MLVSPSEGYGYMITLSSNGTSHSWIHNIFQVTDSGLSKLVERYLYFPHGKHIDLYFDLIKYIGYPRQIEAVSFTHFIGYENGVKISDYSKPVFFPVPNFPVSTPPVKVRQGNVETTELRINSVMPFDSTVSLISAFSFFSTSY